MELRIKPFYGWGWFKANGDMADVPAPFELRVTVLEPGRPFQIALGQVPADREHPLAGLWIILSQRHSPSDEACNLAAFAQKPVMSALGQTLKGAFITGFAFASEISIETGVGG